MYGFIHCALADLVVGKFGEEVWRAIVAKAGVELDGGSYLIHKIYDDQETLSLVAAACETLGLELNAVLEVFGAHFLEYCVQSGYDRILRVLGRNLRDFLCNLDALHDHLQSIYPGMEAPSFRCTETDDGTLLLHYYSKRPGLSYIVIGLVKAIAKQLLDTEMTCDIHQDLDEDNDHVIFAVREVECKSPTASKLGLQTFDMVGRVDKKGPARDACSTTRNPSEKHGEKMSLLSFCKAFPFHVMFDRKLHIKQAGLSLMRLIKYKPNSTLVFTDIFDLARPRMDFSFETVISHINTVFIVTTKPGVIDFPVIEDPTCETTEEAKQSILRLKGQMLYIPESDCLLFLCSPRVSNLDSFREKNLYFSDIPIHDATRDLLFMSHARRAERELVEKLEETSNNLKKIESKLIDHKKKTDDLLHSILPKEVAAKLRLNQPVPAESYKVVTILFSDIVGFTALCSNDKVVPMDIVKLLNKLYTYFDMLSGMNDVYKVETIGDAYMVVGGLPHPCENHAQKVVNMGCSMMEATNAVHSPVDKNPITIRIGIHTGPVMAGVVGKKMPRYCLFGSTVTLANKMESGSQPGRINISIDTKNLVDPNDFIFEANTVVPNPLPCFFVKRSPMAARRASIVDIASSVAPNSICMFRSPIGSPTNSPVPRRRASSVETPATMPRQTEKNSKFPVCPMKRRTTVHKMPSRITKENGLASTPELEYVPDGVEFNLDDSSVVQTERDKLCALMGLKDKIDSIKHNNAHPQVRSKEV